MDNLAEYRAHVQRILTRYAALVAGQPEPGAESLLAFDEERDQYLWLQVGWPRQRRLYGVTVHARLHDGKIWIEQDWTEDGIATELRRAGVPAEDIVLAFQGPEARTLAEVVLA
jgi:hypothetical protein